MLISDRSPSRLARNGYGQQTPSGQQSPTGQHDAGCAAGLLAVRSQHGPAGQHTAFGQQDAVAVEAWFAGTVVFENANARAWAPRIPAKRAVKIENLRIHFSKKFKIRMNEIKRFVAGGLAEPDAMKGVKGTVRQGENRAYDLLFKHEPGRRVSNNGQVDKEVLVYFLHGQRRRQGGGAHRARTIAFRRLGRFFGRIG